MTPVSAPADKRFRRSRVSPARKRQWWKPSWWTVARVGGASLVVAFALYHTIGFVLASDALTVMRITVQGNQRMSRGEVLGLLDGLSGTSIVLTDLESWRQRLLMSPWVADASIRRMFPGTLAVVIEERQPIGIGRIKGTLYLIDKTGTVIDEFGPNYSDLDLTSSSDTARLYARLKYASKKVCNSYDSRALGTRDLHAVCFDQALNSAVAEVNDARLTSLHASEPKIRLARKSS